MRRFWLGVSAAVLAVSASAGPDPRRLYDDGLRLYREGRFREAVSAFVQVRGLSPGYREVDAYLDRCAEAVKDQEDQKRRESSVRQAREILDARQKALASLQSLGAARVRDDGTRTELEIPVPRLFKGDEPDPSASGGPLLDALKDFITTFHTPYVAVSWPSERDPDAEPMRLGARRAVGLGLLFLKRCGLAPERLFVRARPDDMGRIRLLVSTTRPDPEELGREFQPVMVHASRRELEAGGPSTVLNVILLDSARVKDWRLQIIAPDGHAVRRFEGGQDFSAFAAWDGNDARGARVPPGLYQVFLTADTWTAQVRTDNIALAVLAPPKAASPPPPLKKGPATGDERDVAKWFHAVLFNKDADAIPGPMELVLEQAARTLRLYPGRRVTVEGFAAPDEPGGRRLAERRATAVRDALVKKHGVDPGRIEMKGNPPRAPLEGEVLRKALIFFLE